jgi:hypothetical protein
LFSGSSHAHPDRERLGSGPAAHQLTDILAPNCGFWELLQVLPVEVFSF